MESNITSLLDKADEPTVSVVGLGYVGLPVALALVHAGFQVVGYDINQAHVDAILGGDPQVATVTDEELRDGLDTGRFLPTTDPDPLERCSAVIICVPSPLGRGGVPDPSAIRAASELVARKARPGVLVVLESTSYPGTTRELVLPPLQARLGEVGRDFFLAFVPERIDPGNAQYNLRNTPRIVGGITPACARRAAALYERFVPQCHLVSSPEVAETAKLLENAFRNINIAWVNELMAFCQEAGIDVDEVIQAASTKPFGYMPFWPGPGVGGECIPVDPRYLAWRARMLRSPLRLLETAMDINDQQPDVAVEQIVEALNQGGHAVNEALVLLLGVAYKPDTNDVRNAPALVIIDRLLNRGARVLYHDPHVPRLEIPGHGAKNSVQLHDELLEAADITVLLTRHPGLDYERVQRVARRFLDLTHGTPAVMASDDDAAAADDQAGSAG